jgi:PAS domain S-box-containing protein
MGSTSLDRAHMAGLPEEDREAIASEWERGLSGTGYVSFGPVQVHEHLLEWLDQLISLICGEPHDSFSAQSVGSAIARLYYGHPATLSETLKVLGVRLPGVADAVQIDDPRPAVMSILADVSAGFLNETRLIVLSDQETIRNALLTARVQAEEALRQSEARFRALFESAAIGIGIGDTQGKILDANPALQKLLGYTRDEMRNRTVAEFMHPDDLGPVWASYQQLVSGQIDYFQLEKQFFRSDGQSVWTHLTVSLVRDAAGDPQLQIAMIENVTERKQAEETVKRLNADLERRVLDRTAQLTELNQELTDEIARRSAVEAERLQLLARAQTARADAEAAQQRLAFLAEASTVLASSLDYRTTLASLAHLAVPRLADWCAVDAVSETGDINRVAVAHLDLTKVEAVRAAEGHYPPIADALSGVVPVLETGRSEFVPERSGGALEREPDDPRLRDLLSKLQPRARMTVPLMTPGRERATVTLVFGESGRAYTRQDLALAEDLARRAALAIDSARLYREAQQALAARDEFLSVAAHELKTPITSLRGYAQLTLRTMDQSGGVDPERLRQALSVINIQSDRLTRLVSQLLDVSRIQSGKLTPDYREADLSQLAADIVAHAEQRAPDHVFELRSPIPAHMRIDTLRIEQVLTNLLDNAIKHSPSGSSVEVDVDTETLGTGLVLISVRDHGVGIPAELRERIFERFYQAGTSSSHSAGMGLGLYVSRQIVELHGGRIWAEAPQGAGAQFVIALPLDPGAAPLDQSSRVDQALAERMRRD